VTGDRMTGAAATVVLGVVAGSAMTIGSTRTYALAKGHGLDGTAALLVAVSLGGLIVGASLVLLHEERWPWVPGTAEGMQLLGLAVMAAADIVSGARNGLLGAIISAWPAVAFFGAADMVLELVHRSRRRCREARPATAPAVPSEVQQAVRCRVPGLSAGRRPAEPAGDGGPVRPVPPQDPPARPREHRVR
jgi:hypothetical protein